MPAGDPSVRSAWEATGETRYRLGWSRKVILEIEETCMIGRATPNGFNYEGAEVRRRWRDATFHDLQEMDSKAGRRAMA